MNTLKLLIFMLLSVLIKCTEMILTCCVVIYIFNELNEIDELNDLVHSVPHIVLILTGYFLVVEIISFFQKNIWKSIDYSEFIIYKKIKVFL